MRLKVIAALSSALILVPVAAAKSPPSPVCAAARGARSRLGVAADLKAGRSLAQIATAHGKTADGLIAAMLAPAKLELDAAVAAGRLTSDNETAFLTKLRTALTTIVDDASTPRTTTHSANVRVTTAAILEPALTYLQLDLEALVAQLRSGKTLAEVAVAQGKTAQGLVDAVVAAVKTQLDARVTAGKLTAAQETAFLATVQTSVTKLVDG